MSATRQPRPPSGEWPRASMFVAYAMLILTPLIASASSANRQRPHDLSRAVTTREDERVVEGTEVADVLVGESGPDWIFSEAGDDHVRGGAGEDMLDGGPGDDYLDGEEGGDVLDGGAGDDRLFGAAGDDVLDGGDDDDLLDGGEGDDNASGGDQNDIVLGGAGNDILYGDDHDDVLSGGAGNDRMNGGDGHDLLRGGPDDDLVDGHDGDDILDGGEGDDRLRTGIGNDVARGGEGDDLLIGSLGVQTLEGGPGADQLFGGAADDVLRGGLGDDRLYGGLGSDRVFGDDGADRLLLRAGDADLARTEELDGGDGEDTLVLNGFPVGACDPPPEGSVCAEGITDPETGGRFSVRSVEQLRHLHVTGPVAASGRDLVGILTNPSSATVSAVLRLHAADGSAILSEDGMEVDVPSRAQVTVPLSGPSASTRASLSVMASDRLGVQLRGLQAEGLSSSELSLTDSAYVPFVRRHGTSLAVTKGAVGGTVKIDLLALPQGVEVDSFEIDLPAHGHTVLAVPELFTELTDPGALRIEGGELAAAALVAGVTSGSRSVPVLPVLAEFSRNAAAGNAPSSVPTELYLPNLALEPGDRAEIFLVNMGTEPIQGGQVSFFDDGGDPLEIMLEDRGVNNSFPFELSGGGVMIFRPLGGTRASGSVRITTDAGSMQAALEQIRGGERDASRARRPERAVAFAIPGGTRDISVAITAVEPVHLRVDLRDPTGLTAVGGQRTLELSARQTFSGSLMLLLPALESASARGTLILRADSGTFVARVTMRRADGVAALVPVPIRQR